MEHFTQWFNEKLKVDRFPVLKELQDEGKHADVEVVINVSDEFYFEYVNEIMKLGKQHYYFPMGERSLDMGLASLYGALEVLYYAYQNDRKVLLHCQAGLNRSPTVQCAMYYMITGNHIAENVTKGGIFLKSNRLFDNSGIHLPNLWWLEEWLMNCRIVHQTPDRFPFGGKYDFTISKTDSVKIR